MKRSIRFALLVFPLLVLLIFHPFGNTAAQQSFDSPTPTYDVLIEPPLPENPTDLELGRNLYWHWCMTCHGDHGQGLTDEFRGVWESEHQNCWGRGCHAGQPGDTGFPIPTVVPALVTDTHLAQFASLYEFSDFLKATHPPQSPGILKDEEYHAIALFVFTMNQRSLIGTVMTETSVPTPAATRTPVPEAAARAFPVSAVAILMVFVAFLVLVGITQTFRLLKK